MEALGGKRCLMTVYWLLFIAAAFTNKYILSVLHFTYPTIFQGWQTLVGACTLWLLRVSGVIDLQFNDITRSNLAPWIPAMLLFVSSIYTGSVALSKLPVPSFMSLQNLLLVEDILSEEENTEGFDVRIKLLRLVLLFFTLCSAVAAVWNDPQFDLQGYMWMALHLLTTGGYAIYGIYTKKKVKLRAFEKLFCNFTYSFILLAPSSILLGDVLAARDFPFLYFLKFYVGCVLSGVFGVFLSVTGVALSNLRGESHSPEKDNTIARCLAAMLSLLVFKTTLTALYTLWTLLSCVSALLYLQLPQLLFNSNSQTL